MGRTTTILKEEKRPDTHPIWRGVGFVMMVLLPVMAYAGSNLLLQENDKRGWFEIPKEIIVSCPGPNLVLAIPCPHQNFLAIIFLTIVIWIIFLAIFQLITFVAFRLFGAPRYGPTDMPPIRRKVRRRWKR